MWFGSISPMVRDAEHLLMCLLCICVSSLGKCLVKSSVGLLFFFMLSCLSSLYSLDINPYRIYHLQTPSPTQQVKPLGLRVSLPLMGSIT